MVNKCSTGTLNCRSGYAGENKNPDVTFDSFPFHNQELLQKWLKCLAKDFKPTKHSRICSLHLKKNDFVVESTDNKSRREREKIPNW